MPRKYGIGARMPPMPSWIALMALSSLRSYLRDIAGWYKCKVSLFGRFRWRHGWRGSRIGQWRRCRRAWRGIWRSWRGWRCRVSWHRRWRNGWCGSGWGGFRHRRIGWFFACGQGNQGGGGQQISHFHDISFTRSKWRRLDAD